VHLSLADFDRTAGSLWVRGKGNKLRSVPVNRVIGGILEGWISLRGTHTGPLFLPVNKAGKVGTTQLSEQAVYTIFRRLSTIAKVERFSPHDLRRSFVSNLLDAGVDLSTVQGLAGHASVTTTTRYDRRGEHAKRRAVELLSFAAKSNRDAA
jgi:integrase